MLLSPFAIHYYSKYLTIHDAITLENTSKKFKSVVKYRFITISTLLYKICNVSNVKFTNRIFNNIYNILSKLYLIDYAIFIGSTNKYLTDTINRLSPNKYQMLNLFSINLIHSKSSGDTTYYSNSTNGSTYLIDSKEILFKDLIKYLNQVNKLLSNPNILLELLKYLSRYFAEKYGIECQKETSSYSGTYSNIIVPLNTIFPPQYGVKCNLLYKL